MRMKQKLILLTGSAGIGKSTIAQMYIDEHPLSMAVEGDQIIGMMGCWRQHEPEARKLKLEHIKALMRTHLEAGHDVLLPYLVTDASHVNEFESIAKECEAEFHEIALLVEKGEAADRLLERGRWGEAGSKQLTEEDRPNIENLYDMMVTEIEKRPNMIKIPVEKGNVGKTYTKFIQAIS